MVCPELSLEEMDGLDWKKARDGPVGSLTPWGGRNDQNVIVHLKGAK